MRLANFCSPTAYISMLVAFLSAWHWKTTGNLSESAVVTFVALSSTTLIYGRFVLRLSPLSPKLTDTLTLQFLFGFLLFNTALFILSLAFAWGVAICFLVLVAVGLLLL